MVRARSTGMEVNYNDLTSKATMISSLRQYVAGSFEQILSCFLTEKRSLQRGDRMETIVMDKDEY